MSKLPAERDTRWSADQFAPDDRTDALQHAMSLAYLPVELTKRVRQDFGSRLRTRTVDGLTLVECSCDPCEGRRHPSALRHAVPTFGIQIIQSGVEQIRFGAEVLTARAGDVIAWRSDVPYEFEVTQPLFKTTLTMPWSDFAMRVPRASRFRGCRTTVDRGVGLLMDGLMKQMVGRLDDLRAGKGTSCLQGVFSAASAALVGGLICDDDRALSDMYLEQVQQYIARNLHDSELTVERIALSQRLSVRYVHKLFEKLDCSVSDYVSRLRLAGCRQALSERDKRDINIMEIAVLWGYTDASRFSRSFRRQYGMSPSEFRRAHSSHC